MSHTSMVGTVGQDMDVVEMRVMPTATDGDMAGTTVLSLQALKVVLMLLVRRSSLGGNVVSQCFVRFRDGWKDVSSLFKGELAT
jgi:hypothetical protein